MSTERRSPGTQAAGSQSQAAGSQSGLARPDKPTYGTPRRPGQPGEEDQRRHAPSADSVHATGPHAPYDETSAEGRGSAPDLRGAGADPGAQGLEEAARRSGENAQNSENISVLGEDRQDDERQQEGERQEGQENGRRHGEREDAGRSEHEEGERTLGGKMHGQTANRPSR